MGGGASHTLNNDHPLKSCSSQQLNTANNFMRCFVHSINEFVSVTSSMSNERPAMSVETSDALDLCISSFENLLKVCNLDVGDRGPVAKMLGFATVLATERTVLAAKSGETVFTSLESKDPAKENMSMAHSSKVIPPLQARSSKHFEADSDAMQSSELPSWCSPEDFKLYDMLRNVADEGKHFQSRMLAEKDIFVLDNSIQESTCADRQGHSIEDKNAILSAVKQTGISNFIVSSFGKLPSATEDAWAAHLQEKNDLYSVSGGYCYGHSELFETVDEMQWPVSDIDPIGLVKIKQYKIPNAVFSVDVMHGLVSWEDQGGSCPISTFADLIKVRIQAVRSVNSNARIFINFRDAPTAFKSVIFAYRLIQLTKYIARLPVEMRPFGILFEDATGESFPWEFANLCHVLNATVETSGWTDCQLLVHVNKKYGLAESCVLHALASGATGIWGGLTDDGPACGSAGMIVTLANLSRLGNEYVKREYNFEKLFAAAHQIGTITALNPRQEVFGTRALDIFIGDNNLQLAHSFSFYSYVGVKEFISIDHTTPAATVRDRFAAVFGKTAADYSLDLCKKVKAVMWEATTEGRKCRYSTPAALLELYKKAGGTDLSADMQRTVEESAAKSDTADNHPLIIALRSVFDSYDGVKSATNPTNNSRLSSITFYHAFLSSHLADTTAAKLDLYCSVIDDQEPGFVSWDKVSAHAKNLLVEHESDSAAWSTRDIITKFVELKVLPLVYHESEARKREANNR